MFSVRSRHGGVPEPGQNSLQEADGPQPSQVLHRYGALYLPVSIYSGVHINLDSDEIMQLFVKLKFI